MTGTGSILLPLDCWRGGNLIYPIKRAPLYPALDNSGARAGSGRASDRFDSFDP
jgi:hypothetical protein